jgi:hypothetical protein
MVAFLALPLALQQQTEESGAKAIAHLHIESVGHPIVYGVQHNLEEYQESHTYAVVEQLPLSHTRGNINGILAE